MVCGLDAVFCGTLTDNVSGIALGWAAVGFAEDLAFRAGVCHFVFLRDHVHKARPGPFRGFFLAAEDFFLKRPSFGTDYDSFWFGAKRIFTMVVSMISVGICNLGLIIACFSVHLADGNKVLMPNQSAALKKAVGRIVSKKW